MFNVSQNIIMIKVYKNNVEKFIKDYYKAYKSLLYIEHVEGDLCFLKPFNY